jgi:hypothetical protein
LLVHHQDAHLFHQVHENLVSPSCHHLV